ncbi:MAG: penicillin-binding protein activator, partial [Candidatus Obscuribacterales bacterium]|nr:penicillin-binding protein activator [Steroidobacteraceae bacterium]
LGDRRPKIRIYDSAPGALAAYQRAIADGAQYVVGPLIKEEIQQILAAPVESTAADGATANQNAVPMLALNLLSDSPIDARAPGNAPLYQFALDPAEEAEQVAARLISDGKHHGMALVPNNDWGQRVQRAFEARLVELGGNVVATRAYDPAAKDFSDPIRSALLIDESRARANALSGSLGTRLEFEPRARADVEFVFIAAQPNAGRLLRPALRFHLVEDLPVYSTSQIFEPDSVGNMELEGVLFPDMPLVIAPDDVATQLRNTLTRYWPGRVRTNARLFAFGFDAYRLIPVLQGQHSQVSSSTTPGMTGLLSVDGNGRVRRLLEWARVVGGQARPIVSTASESQAKN